MTVEVAATCNNSSTGVLLLLAYSDADMFCVSIKSYALNGRPQTDPM